MLSISFELDHRLVLMIIIILLMKAAKTRNLITGEVAKFKEIQCLRRNSTSIFKRYSEES